MQDLSYAEDKLFNMQCYICDAKYAFLEDIGYIYRKNDMSVSWQYRPDSVENWFKLVYELKSWIEKKDKDPKEYTSLIGYLLIFAAFFDGKMEYMQHKKSLWAVRKVLKKYGGNPMGRKAFTELADRRKKLQITQNCGDYDPDIFIGNEMEMVSVDVCGNKDLGFLPGR